MHKLFLTLMMGGLISLAAPAHAAGKDDPTDPSYPAFAALRTEMEQADTNGIKDNKTGTISYPKYFAAAQTNTGLRAAGCNPVVWASLQYTGLNAVNKEVARNAEINKSIDLKNNTCTDLVGRTNYVNQAREKVNQADNIINVIAALVGLSPEDTMDIATEFNFRPSDFVMANLNQAIDQQCLKYDNVRNNMFENMNGAFGSAVMNSATNEGAFTVKFNPASAKPPVDDGNKPAGANAVRLPAEKPKPVAPAAAPAPTAPQAAAPQQKQTPAPTAPATPAAPTRSIYQ